MGIYQDLAAIERLHEKAQKRANKFLGRLRKRGHVRMSLWGLMAHTANFQLLELTTKTLDMIEVRLV